MIHRCFVRLTGERAVSLKKEKTQTSELNLKKKSEGKDLCLQQLWEMKRRTGDIYIQYENRVGTERNGGGGGRNDQTKNRTQ